MTAVGRSVTLGIARTASAVRSTGNDLLQEHRMLFQRPKLFHYIGISGSTEMREICASEGCPTLSITTN